MPFLSLRFLVAGFWGFWLMAVSAFSAHAGELSQVKLYWTAPAQFTNGERIKRPTIELHGFRVYYGPSQQAVRSRSLLLPATANSVPLSNLELTGIQSPIVYLAVTAISRSGQESDLSEIVFFLP